MALAGFASDRVGFHLILCVLFGKCFIVNKAAFGFEYLLLLYWHLYSSRTGRGLEKRSSLSELAILGEQNFGNEKEVFWSPAKGALGFGLAC